MHQKSFTGCWTCRLRRKKCDERQPVCDTCGALDITCHYGSEKPVWMDGGIKQEEMAEVVKLEVKEGALRRRSGRAFALAPGNHDKRTVTAVETQKRGSSGVSPSSTARHSSHDADASYSEASLVSLPPSQPSTQCKLSSLVPSEKLSFGRSDTFLTMFYLEHVLPFLFPFYDPTSDGGKAWILEMMISSPVVRQATLCQSSYFHSLANATTSQDEVWETIVAQSKEAFGMLGQALKVIEGSDIADHQHGAVRVLASIMQVQRFEISLLSFENCHAHLDAAMALFKQLLSSVDPEGCMEPRLRLHTLSERLGPSLVVAQSIPVPSAEQMAFKFSASLLILDDIIASTVLREEPRLLQYHAALETVGFCEAIIDLEAITGCQNWVMQRISDIAVLHTWKYKSQTAGTLDVIELVRRATIIKDSLEASLTSLETQTAVNSTRASPFVGVFGQQSTHLSQTPLVTRIWAHAALIYLSVVVSGWQRASTEVRYHVEQVLNLLEHQISPPTLLRTMSWPFAVVGCVADPGQQDLLRRLVDPLQPATMFGTVRKALHIIEQAWDIREQGDPMNYELTPAFKCHGNLVLLV